METSDCDCIAPVIKSLQVSCGSPLRIACDVRPWICFRVCAMLTNYISLLYELVKFVIRKLIARPDFLLSLFKISERVCQCFLVFCMFLVQEPHIKTTEDGASGRHSSSFIQIYPWSIGDAVSKNC